MKTISKSKIICYETCPQKYKLQYIDKIKLPTMPVALIKGIDAHENLERYIANLDLEAAMKSPRTAITEAMNKDLDVVQIETLKGFCEYEIKRAANCIRHGKSLDKYFMPVHTEIKITSKKYGVVGVIDRVDKLFNDKIGIFDYKTGQNKSISDWNEIELMMYKLLYEEKFGETVGLLGIIYVSHLNPLRKLIPTKSLEHKVLKRIENIKDCINMELFHAPESPLFCPCEYMEWCEKYKK